LPDSGALWIGWSIPEIPAAVFLGMIVIPEPVAMVVFGGEYDLRSDNQGIRVRRCGVVVPGRTDGHDLIARGLVLTDIQCRAIIRGGILGQSGSCKDKNRKQGRSKDFHGGFSIRYG
jgi:hypothetical protein